MTTAGREDYNPMLDSSTAMPSPDQAWYWTPKWQAEEREAEDDLRTGRFDDFETVRELVADMKFDDWFDEQMRDPDFKIAYRRAAAWRAVGRVASIACMALAVFVLWRWGKALVLEWVGNRG